MILDHIPCSPINFCGKTALNIQSNEYKQYLLDEISQKYKYDCRKRFFKLAQVRRDQNTFNKNRYVISSYTVGTPYYLYLTRDELDRPYCVLIDEVVKRGHEYPKMILCFFRFTDSVFNGTLLHGEMVRSGDNWSYIINDMLVNEGRFLLGKKWDIRLPIVQNLLQNKWVPDSILQSCPLYHKRFFNSNDSKELLEEFIPSLPYPCRGLLFHCIHSTYRNRCYLFKQRLPYKKQTPKPISEPKQIRYNHKPRTLHKTQQFKRNKQYSLIPITMAPKTTPATSSPTPIKHLDRVRSSHTHSRTSPQTSSAPTRQEPQTCLHDFSTQNSSHIREVSDVVYSDLKTAHFLVSETQRPDVYRLYVSHKDKIKKYSYAHIPDITTSKFMKSVFPKKNAGEVIDVLQLSKNKIMIEFMYSPDFEKWIPKKKSLKKKPDRYSSIKKIIETIQKDKKGDVLEI